MKRRWIAVALLVIGVLFTAHVATAPGFTVHEPISIKGNDGFKAYPEIKGSGTEKDPYVIEGWEIDAQGGHGHIYRRDGCPFRHQELQDLWWGRQATVCRGAIAECN